MWSSIMNPIAKDQSVTAWWKPYESTGVLMPGAVEFVEMEQKATAIWHISTLLVPGLFQTEQYIDAVLRLWPTTRSLSTNSPNSDLVKFRLNRQWHLLEKARPPKMNVLIDEVALIRRVGGPHVMYGQLLHLQKIAEQTNINLRLLPVDSPLSSLSLAGAAAATLLSFDSDEADVLSIENTVGALANTRSVTDTQAFRMEFISLQKKALSPAKTKQRLAELAEHSLKGKN